MLEVIVTEMTTNALKKEDSPKRIAVGDKLYDIEFTCGVLSEELIWNLSISTFPHGEVSLEQAEQLRAAFFRNWESIEIPSLINGNYVRHYIGRVRL